jgi:hypothetical protein
MLWFVNKVRNDKQNGPAGTVKLTLSVVVDFVANYLNPGPLDYQSSTPLPDIPSIELPGGSGRVATRSRLSVSMDETIARLSYGPVSR